MMELNPVFSVLSVEAMLAMLALIIAWYVRRGNKHKQEFNEIERFVEQIINDDVMKSQMLQTFLFEKLGADQQRLTEAVRELGATERALMQRVIQMFLERDPSLLTEIDRLLAGCPISIAICSQVIPCIPIPRMWWIAMKSSTRILSPLTVRKSAIKSAVGVIAANHGRNYQRIHSGV